MSYRILERSDYKVSEWTGGETSQIMIYPEASSLEKRDFIFRVSSATCPEEESPFSDFTGFSRYISSLDEILILDHEGEKRKINPYEVYFFDGADRVASKSAVRDFNLILKEGVRGSMRSKALITETSFNFKTGKNLIFNYDSPLELEVDGRSTRLEEFSTIVIEDEELELVLRPLEGQVAKIFIVEIEL